MPRVGCPSKRSTAWIHESGQRKRVRVKATTEFNEVIQQLIPLYSEYLRLNMAWALVMKRNAVNVLSEHPPQRTEGDANKEVTKIKRDSSCRR